jgi:hypothetical protein
MNREYKIHAFYILLILVSIIICLISVKWSDIPGLVGYITFALTVSSLSLAVLAIIYSIYSNSTLSQNVVSLERASRDVSDTAKIINEVTTGLALKVEAIPPLIETVGARVEHTHQLIEGMSKKPSEKDSIQSTTAQGINNKFEDAILLFSISGVLSLYACSLALNKAVAFKLTELCEKTKFLNPMYMHGFLVAVSSFGALGFTVEKDILNVIDINESLNPLIKPRVDQIIETEKDEKTKELTNQMLEAIEKYFSN